MKYDVCVFGGCSLDQMFYGDANGVYKEIPDLSIPGGKGSNQAVAASRAGAKVVIITKLGNDEVGEKIRENLLVNGVNINGVELIDNLQNDMSKIYIDGITRDNDIHRQNGAIDSFDIGMIERHKDLILNSKVIVAQMKCPKEVSLALINFCYENNKPVIITPCRPEKLDISNEENLNLIEKISYITANKKECKTIFGTDDVESCVRKYPNKLIVTLGEDGVMYCDGNEIIHIPANEVSKVLDTTGAGDTFNGNLAYCLTNGYELYDAIIRSQFASSMKIQVKTAQDGMPYKEELENYMQKKNTNNFKYKKEFEIAYKGIFKAYEIIKNNNFKISEKDDKTFVTESDLLIEKIIMDEIKNNFNNENFVTEETNSKNEIKNRTWIIDPIDGTAHYMKKSIFWGIQVAFIDEGKVKFSIIFLPKLNEVYYALEDKGVYLNNIKVNIPDDVEFNKSIVEFCGSLHKYYEDKIKVFNKLMLSEDRVANFMHINSCCFAFANLISGKTDAMILSTKKPWDILPGKFMCKEAGIKLYKFGELEIYSKCSSLIKKLINQ